MCLALSVVRPQTNHARHIRKRTEYEMKKAFCLLALMTWPANATIQCHETAPNTPGAFWSWRLIDNRKCWYEGRPGMDKGNLSWKEVVQDTRELLPVPNKTQPASETIEVPAQADTFEERWKW